MAERCIPCEEARKLKGRGAERKRLLERLNELYKNETTIKTIAIVKTKTGFLSRRNPGDKSLKELTVVEYLSKLPGTAFE